MPGESMKIKLKVLVLILVLAIGVGGAFAQEEENLEAQTDAELDAELEALLSEDEEVPVYKYPDIKPEFSLYVGYRFTGISGAEIAEDYEFINDSVVFGGDARIFEFPHRAHLNFEELNRKDYFGELRYAYKDLVLFRWISTSLFHNLENIKLLDLGSAGSAPDVDVRDHGEDYGISSALNRVFIRLKYPDYAAHVFVDYYSIMKDGTRQQRSLLGSGWFNNVVRTSQEREVDLNTDIYTIGANSHLGLIEAEYSHTEKRLNVEGDRIFLSSYTNSPRPAGIYPHNLTPEFEGSTDTIKLHTSYTGRLVASATFSIRERTNKNNRFSGATADYFVGSGSVTWIPATNLTFFLNYKHLGIDVDNTGTSITAGAKPSIESATDTVKLVGRYRPIKGLTARIKYLFEDKRRENNRAWGLRSDTAKNAVTVSADLDLPKNIDLEAEYTYTHIEDPAYNTEPDDANEGSIAVTWVPVPRFRAFARYNKTLENRDVLIFTGTSNARNREVDRDHIMGSGTLMINDKFSVSASYTYMSSEVEQDIVYQDATATNVVDSGAEYEESSSVYSLDAYLSPMERLGLHGGITHTLNRGTFSPSSTDLLQPVSVSEFGDYKFSETVFSASGNYRIGRGVSVSVEYKYSDLDEAMDNPHDNIEDGDVQIVMLKLAKEWK
jgi:predicted porin